MLSWLNQIITILKASQQGSNVQCEAFPREQKLQLQESRNASLTVFLKTKETLDKPVSTDELVSNELHAINMHIYPKGNTAALQLFDSDPAAMLTYRHQPS